MSAKKIREIVLDTETTGLSTELGDRIIEIGCIELINRIPTGKVFHEYISPEREIPYYATKIHGITSEFLIDKPVFADVVKEFLEFIGDDILVIHNAEFDVKFLNMEFNRLNLRSIPISRAIDTLSMARKKFPGSPASLDALCKRFNISLENRDNHGALIDAELLAKVYVELTGGLQITLNLNKESNKVNSKKFNNMMRLKQLKIRNYQLQEEEMNNHIEFLKNIKNPIWNDFAVMLQKPDNA